MCEGWLWQTCPDQEMRPQWRHADAEIIFPNKSRISLVGVDVSPDRLRGPAMDSGYADEVAFYDDADYIISSVLMPQMQGRPHAKLMLGSTPPRSPAHEWSTRYVPKARIEGAYAHRTIRDNPRLSESEIEYWIQEAGGPEHTTCRRELFAEHVVDEDRAIIPEFKRHKDEVVRIVDRPPWFHAYVALDPGWTHHSAGVFGYYDMEGARVVIEDDFSLPRQNSRVIAELIKQKEKELWNGCAYYQGDRKPLHAQPYLRVSDTDMRLISDLMVEHDLRFIPTAKDNRDAAINSLRLHIQTGRFIVHPRAKNTIAHLEYGIWNRRRTEFEETKEFGHFDCVSACIYLDRMVDRGLNPYPPRDFGLSASTHFLPPRVENQRGRGWQKLKTRKAGFRR